MFYHLLYPLHSQISAFNVFRYITFRTIYHLFEFFAALPAEIRISREISVAFWTAVDADHLVTAFVAES